MKHVIRILLIGAILIFAVSATAEFLCGDGNSDGSINIMDITLTLKYLYQGAFPPYLVAADVNNDDIVNILDVTALINFIYKGGPALNCASPGYIYMYISDSSECKEFEESANKWPAPPNTSVFEYDYDNQGNLILVHQNAGLNCGAIFAADYFIYNDTIKIIEIDSVIGDPVPCLCLYDITFQLHNVVPGTYTFVLEEPYWNPSDGDPLTPWTVVLIGLTSGERQVFREEYPWGGPWKE